MKQRKFNFDLTPLSDLELQIIAKLSAVSFQPYTASKRFARALTEGRIKNLSPAGRRFLAFIVHRFRRQINLNPDQSEWLKCWNNPAERANGISEAEHARNL